MAHEQLSIDHLIACVIERFRKEIQVSDRESDLGHLTSPPSKCFEYMLRIRSR